MALFYVGLTLSCVTQKPKYSIYDWENEDFSILNFIPFPCDIINLFTYLVK